MKMPTLSRGAGALRLLLIFILAAAALAGAEVKVSDLVEDLRQAEHFRGQDGAAGERGDWQLMPATWIQHMPGISFDQARQLAPSRLCATRHVAWLRKGLRAAGWDDSPYNIALAWNAGLARTVAGKAPRSSRDFAQRVFNLYRR